MVYEFHQSKYVEVEHIPDIINPFNTFTIQMKDNTHFRNLIDSMMVSLQAFMKYSHSVTSHIIYDKNSFPTIPYGQNTYFQTVWNSNRGLQNTLFQTFWNSNRYPYRPCKRVFSPFLSTWGC